MTRRNASEGIWMGARRYNCAKKGNEMLQAANPEETTTFIPAPTAHAWPVFGDKGVVTRPSRKTPPAAPECACDELFAGSHVPEEPGQLNEVLGLMERHKKILSITRSGTKTMEATFLRLGQLESGGFVYAYAWDKNWWNRVSAGCPVQDVRFSGREELLARIDDVLGYVEERQEYGYWYPPKRGGKAEKASLAAFLASPMKNGNWWSPFLEIACGDCATPKMYRNALGPEVCKALDRILERVWWKRDFSTMLRFYKGVSDLKRWHSENLAAIRARSQENNYRLSSFGAVLEMVERCNEETGCVCPSFVGPWSSKWCVFKDWLKSVHGVTL